MELEALNRRIITCRKCPRLVEWRETVARTKRKAYAQWDYWGKPVPGFGDEQAKILVVGLAPGAHGSNRTGRQFTGDASGRFLYPALHRAGFSTRSESKAREDGLALRGLYLTALCRCVPPANKPAPDELAHCRPYLEREIELLAPKVIVCLGRLAFSGVLKIHGCRESAFDFAHGAAHLIPGTRRASQRWLVCSYHPSQQNTLTGKLTVPMFDRIWITARELARRDHL
jgi:uracil-DNA glycosylase family 4